MKSNNSTIADGIEIDELSSDGQTYTPVDTLSGSTTSDTFAVEYPDTEATYYVYATNADGTNYSDPATVIPGIATPTLWVADGSVTDTSMTLYYTNPTFASLTLYWQTPLDANLHAYPVAPYSAAAFYSIEIDNLTPGFSYNFQLDAFDGVQDVQTAIVSPTTTSDGTGVGAQPVITGETVETDPFGDNGGLIDVTFESVQGNDGASLVLSGGDDPYGLFYNTPVSPTSNPNLEGGGGAIPDISCTSTDGYNWDATFYFPASSENVSIQIMIGDDGGGIPLSAPVTVEAPYFVGDEVAPQPAPTLSATSDDAGDLTITPTATYTATWGGSLSYFAVTGPTTAVPLTDYTDNDDGTITIANGSTYSGDPIFAATFQWLFRYQDESPYWSPYSNYVNGVGAPAAPAPSTLNAPAILSDTLLNDGSTEIQWQDNSDNETGFAVQVLATSGNWITVDVTDPDVTQFDLTSAEVAAAFAGTGTSPAQATTAPTTTPSPTTEGATTRVAAVTYSAQAASLPETVLNAGDPIAKNGQYAHLTTPTISIDGNVVGTVFARSDAIWIAQPPKPNVAPTAPQFFKPGNMEVGLVGQNLEGFHWVQIFTESKKVKGVLDTDRTHTEPVDFYSNRADAAADTGDNAIKAEIPLNVPHLDTWFTNDPYADHQFFALDLPGRVEVGDLPSKSINFAGDTILTVNDFLVSANTVYYSVTWTLTYDAAHPRGVYSGISGAPVTTSAQIPNDLINAGTNLEDTVPPATPISIQGPFTGTPIPG